MVSTGNIDPASFDPIYVYISLGTQWLATRLGGPSASGGGGLGSIQWQTPTIPNGTGDYQAPPKLRGPSTFSLKKLVVDQSCGSSPSNGVWLWMRDGAIKGAIGGAIGGGAGLGVPSGGFGAIPGAIAGGLVGGVAGGLGVGRGGFGAIGGGMGGGRVGGGAGAGAGVLGGAAAAGVCSLVG